MLRTWLLLVLQSSLVLSHDGDLYGNYGGMGTSRSPVGYNGRQYSSYDSGNPFLTSYPTFRSRSDPWMAPKPAPQFDWSGRSTTSFGGTGANYVPQRDMTGSGPYYGRSGSRDWTGSGDTRSGSGTWQSANAMTDWRFQQSVPAYGSPKPPTTGYQTDEDSLYGGSRVGRTAPSTGAWGRTDSRGTGAWGMSDSRGTDPWRGGTGFSTPARRDPYSSGPKQVPGEEVIDSKTLMERYGQQRDSPVYGNRRGAWDGSSSAPAPKQVPGEEVIDSKTLMERYAQPRDSRTYGNRRGGWDGSFSAPAQSQVRPGEISSDQVAQKYGHLMRHPTMTRQNSGKWNAVGSKEFMDEVDEKFRSGEMRRTGKIEWTIRWDKFSSEHDPNKNWKGTGLPYDQIMATHERYMKDYVPPPAIEGVDLLQSLLDFIKKECPEALKDYQQFETPRRVWNRNIIAQQQRMKARVEIPLLLVNNHLFGSIKVGKHEQELSVMFDTGSHHIWVVADGFGRQDNKAYLYGSSGTFQTENQECGNQFGSGWCKGVWGFDTFKLGAGSTVIELPDQGMGLATEYEGMFRGWDALFGLGLVSQEMLPGEPEPPLVRLAQQYQQAPVFGYYLNKYSPGKSKLIFGEDDADLSTGSFTTHTVKPRHPGIYAGWALNCDQIVLGGGIGPIPLDAGTVVIPDSGTTGVVGPKKYFDRINQYIFSLANVDSRDGKSFSCSPSDPAKMLAIMEKLPTITFVIDGVQYTLTAQDYISIGKYTCFTLFRGGHFPEITLGQPFMTKYYTKFDYQTKSVHIAKAKQDHDDNYVVDMLRKLVNSGVEIPPNLK